MSARIIDGKSIAGKVRAEVAAQAKELRARGVAPGLALVLVGDDPGSAAHVRNKGKAARELGLELFDLQLPASVSEPELLARIEELNRDPRVDGILVQLPLPAALDPERVLHAISPDKDVDGLHPDNVGRLWSGRPRLVPCTPLGVLRLLEESGATLRGAEALVIGRSNLVGKPTAALLLQADAAVTIAHSQARDLPALVARADVLVAAAGHAELVRGDWIKPGATVIDVGNSRGPDGKLRGDVEFAAAVARAGAITPVPGGVGPMTIALLLSNAVRSAARRAR
jgi:methylenetetrahydrofolate dehydrogenase (NADP+)/methenyltetrahydrofolate cyclohydrolase